MRTAHNQGLHCARALSGAGAGSLPASGYRGAATQLPADRAVEVLERAFQAQATGRIREALQAYQQVQQSRSPLLRALAGNAKGLMLARSLVSPWDLLPSKETSDLNSDQALTSFTAGAHVIAPWAEDGGEYAAVLEEVDLDAGTCTVSWQDGGMTCREVPIAALTNLNGELCIDALNTRFEEVCAWAARRALRQAMDAWEMQAELGTAHDAFVDLAGLLCDMAFAEIRSVLASPRPPLLLHGFRNARRHLQRARWTCERAYMPDPRAMAAICMHRAELLRMAGAADHCAASAGQDPLRTEFTSSMREVLSLHERAGEHLAAASWNQNSRNSTFWHSSGYASPEVVHELLWAKALASSAMQQPKASTKAALQSRRQSAHTKRSVRCLSAKRSSVPTRIEWSLPEKLLPASLAQASTNDSELHSSCAALACAKRAWRAVCIAAGEPPAGCHSKPLFEACPAEAQRVASALADCPASSKFLLEAAVLIFVMGVKLGRTRWARAFTTPLAQAASTCHVVSESTANRTCPVANFALEALNGRTSVESSTQVITRKELLQGKLNQFDLEQGDALLHVHRDSNHYSFPPRWRWRLVGYKPLEELWLLRLGSRRIVYLPANAPLTICMEGLAVSETTPNKTVK